MSRDKVQERFHARRSYGRLADGRYVTLLQAYHRSGQIVLLPGAVVVELSEDEARRHGVGYATMDDAAEDMGAKREGDRFFIEDNLNSRWDSWAAGGFDDVLKLLPGKRGYTAAAHEYDPEFPRLLNEPPSVFWEPTQEYCDKARKKDIDWEGMRAEAGAKAGAEWDLVHSWTKGTPWSSWAEVQREFTGDAARDHYNAQWAIKAIREGQQTLPPDDERNGSSMMHCRAPGRTMSPQRKSALASPMQSCAMASGWNVMRTIGKTMPIGLSSSMLFWIGSRMR